MRYWYDTEFIEDGKTIDLISIGVVAEDGRKFYFANADCDLSQASEWVKQNVIPHLAASPMNAVPVPKEWIKKEILTFCDSEKYGKPEFWGYYSAYDHVALCQLFGTMMDLPKGWPYYTRDLRQWADSMGITLPLDQLIPQENEHHALADAEWTRKAWLYLKQIEENRLANAA